MRNALLMLARLGSLPPLVGSLAAALMLFVAELLPHGQNPFSVLMIVGTLFFGIVLTAALVFIFRRIWATAVATAVAWLWLIWGSWEMRTSLLHPELYRNSDGPEALLLVIPFGLIGSIAGTAILLNDRVGDAPERSDISKSR